jgi:hypothetical protein
MLSEVGYRWVNFSRLPKLVSNAVNTNQLIGLNAVIKNDRGRRGPIYYTPEKRKHIIDLLESKPGETDEKIAQQANEELGTKISRQAVARIRVEHTKPFNGFSPPNKKELMEIEAATRRMEKRLVKQAQLNFDFENRPGSEGSSLLLTLINFEQGSTVDLTPFFAVVGRVSKTFTDVTKGKKRKHFLVARPCPSI